MPDISVPNLASIRSGNATPAEMARAIESLQDAVNRIGVQTNSAPVGIIPPPPKHVDLNVVGGGGKLAIKIADPQPSNRGVERFADVASDSSFSTFHTIHMGATHNWYGDSPVSGVAYVRTYSQYPTSDTSPHFYHPSPVDTTAGSSAPPLSGNNVSGYGAKFNNSVTQPKRA